MIAWAAEILYKENQTPNHLASNRVEAVDGVGEDDDALLTDTTSSVYRTSKVSTTASTRLKPGVYLLSAPRT